MKSSIFFPFISRYPKERFLALTPLAEIRQHFDGLTYFAVTKIGTRFKERMRGDESLSVEIMKREGQLSRVMGCPYKVKSPPLHREGWGGES
jgi:hypothetical protein